MRPRLKVSSDRLVKPGIEPATSGLQGKRFIHYTTVAPNNKILENSLNTWKIYDELLAWQETAL